MINILSYVGMNMQAEVCLWTLLGLLRTIFDATLFKMNANLKQVWQMTMPEELSKPVQRMLRTMISGVMLVQCFTVYVYLATYIVLLYPVFLEERPTLVLPWLLLAAIRKLLCELTSLALGLGTCVLLGPARPPCIKFVIVKFVSIAPAFYMWMLVYSYYHALKVAAAFKIFPAALASSDPDYGLELAVRRRRTKSLFDEDQLRKKLVANLYEERNTSDSDYRTQKMEISTKMAHSTDTNNEEALQEASLQSLPVSSRLSTKFSEVGAYEDWFGSEVIIPRDTDRILEQIVLMLLRISVSMQKEEWSYEQMQNSLSPQTTASPGFTAMATDDTDTPPQVGSSKEKVRTASYLRNYPQIFMKSQTNDIQPDRIVVSTKSGPEVNQNNSRSHKYANVQMPRQFSDRQIGRKCSIIRSLDSTSAQAGPSKKKVVLLETKDNGNAIKGNDKKILTESNNSEDLSLYQTSRELSIKSKPTDESETTVDTLTEKENIDNTSNLQNTKRGSVKTILSDGTSWLSDTDSEVTPVPSKRGNDDKNSK